MALSRITMATETLNEFTELTSGKQKILIFLLSKRRMHEKPMQPTNYFSYRDIADNTQLTPETVRIHITSLMKNEWLAKFSQRRRFTPEGEEVAQFKFVVLKVVLGLHKVFKAEEAKREAPENYQDSETDAYLFEGKFWRKGGELGWQSRGEGKRMWIDSMLAPDEVRDFFGEDETLLPC